MIIEKITAGGRVGYRAKFKHIVEFAPTRFEAIKAVLRTLKIFG